MQTRELIQAARRERLTSLLFRFQRFWTSSVMPQPLMTRTPLDRVSRMVAGSCTGLGSPARVIERYEDGDTIARVLGDLGATTDFGELATQGRAEAAVLRLLKKASAHAS